MNICLTKSGRKLFSYRKKIIENLKRQISNTNDILKDTTKDSKCARDRKLTRFYNVITGNPFFNTLRPRQNGRHFADDIFKCIFLNENVSIAVKISLKFVPKGPINNIPALVQIMAWRRPGDKPLSEPMMVSLPTHICVTRPQWVEGTHHTVYSAL